MSTVLKSIIATSFCLFCATLFALPAIGAGFAIYGLYRFMVWLMTGA